MAGQWVKAHRSMMDSAIWGDDWLVRLWMWCLFKANYKRGKWREHVVERGQFVTGRNTASDELSVAPSKWYRGIMKLAELGYVKIEANSVWTMVTVCNYETYQSDSDDERTAFEQRLNSERTANEQPANSERTLEKEGKKGRREEVNTKEPAGADRITDGASLPDSTITTRHEIDPKEAQRRADEALEQSLDLVDEWRLPTAIDDNEGRHWVAAWIASRFLAGHGWMNSLQWEGHTSGHRTMSREWWQLALQASAAGGWKNLAKHVAKPVDQCKPKQRKPRLLTPEEIDIYNATGQLPEGALDPL